MSRRVLSLVAALLLPASLCAQDTYGFVARLGRDTAAIERITRTGNHVVSDLVEQAPRAIKRHWEATLAPDGSIRHWAMDQYILNRAPGRPDAWHYVADFAADSVRTTVRVNDTTTYTALKTNDALTMPWDSFIYGTYELLFAAAVRRPGDTVRVGQYFPGYAPLEGGFVRKLPDGKITFVSTGLAGTGAATLDASGRMLSYSGQNTTYKQEVERLAYGPDIDAIATRFAAREKAAGIARDLSFRDTVRATTGKAEILVDYGRPTARGRSILGDVVPFGDVWRTGANAATQFSTSAAISLAGVKLAPGTYTLWTIPQPDGATLIINRQSKQWGTQYDSTRDLARVALRTERLPAVTERFTIAIEPAGNGAATLALQWDTFRWTAPIITR